MSQQYQGSGKAEASDERLCLSQVAEVTSYMASAAEAAADSRGEIDLDFDQLPRHRWGPFQ